MYMKVRGFTLIELLVVLAIIGLLSSIVFTSLNTARAKARDALRKSQTSEFKTALELYYSRNGNYPCGNAGCSIAVVPFNTSYNFGINPANALILDGDISSVPSDPLWPDGTIPQSCNASGPSGYCYCSTGADSYVLTVNTEDDSKGDPTSDRCYIQVGPSASTFCMGHQFPGSWAKIDCSARFQ